jgi:hypothetical protein
VSYVDAGYAAALSVLFGYSVLLIYRHKRLSRLAESIDRGHDEV